MIGNRPHIVIVSIDSLRPDQLVTYGYGKPTSPAIDAVASESVVFDRAFPAGIPIMPPFTSMYTGLHPYLHGIGVLLSPEFARPGNWHLDPVQNLGMFMDDASHAADWLYWMLGRPVSVVAEIDNVVTDVAPDDNGVAVYRFARGEMGILLNSSTMLAAESTTEIYGDRGVILQNYGDAPSSALPRPAGAAALRLYRRGEPDWEVLDYPADVPHAERIRAVPRPLVDYLRGTGQPLATAEDGRVAVEMILGAYESARDGRRVSFPDRPAPDGRA